MSAHLSSSSPSRLGRAIPLVSLALGAAPIPPDLGPDPDAPPADAAPAPPAMLIPPAGRYTYQASGAQATHLLLFTDKEPIGPTVVATVEVSGACWDLTVPFTAGHSETRHLCADASGSLTDLSGAQRQGAFGLKVKVAVTCAPPGWVVRGGMAPGEAWPARCELQNSGADSGLVVAEGTNTFLGEEVVMVGGEPVAAWHLREERAISGAQEGSYVAEEWISVASGLIVQLERHMALAGVARYVEDERLVLISTQPTP